MRKLILLIVFGLAVGALFGQLMQSLPGYWFIRVGDTSIQTSFWFGCVLLLAAFLILHFLLRALTRLRRPVSRLKVWNSRTRHRTCRTCLPCRPGCIAAPATPRHSHTHHR